MQFITTGNRIAVENFTLGDLYTITFTNGTYINSACIGIGENFVSFQRNEPELLFSLTMATAELVSSIELYAGGSGTNNYNDLTNKPQINDVELVGNKSLSDLGIQATISDIDTIRSGAAAGATAVQPAALANYQPIISDLDTIRSGAAAGATAVQPAALAGYQTIIDSSHKLDADLVDDTTATHKFATAAQLSQIETNKNNILSLTERFIGCQFIASRADYAEHTFTVNRSNTTGRYHYGIFMVGTPSTYGIYKIFYNDASTPASATVERVLGNSTLTYTATIAWNGLVGTLTLTGSDRAYGGIRGIWFD